MFLKKFRSIRSTTAHNWVMYAAGKWEEKCVDCTKLSHLPISFVESTIVDISRCTNLRALSLGSQAILPFFHRLRERSEAVRQGW